MSYVPILLDVACFLFQSCALYWPEEYGYTVEYGPLSIELLFSSEADTNITVRTFKLTNTLKVIILIIVYVCASSTGQEMTKALLV